MNPIVKKNGITFGIISGIVSVLITAIIYAVDMSLFASMLTMGVIIAIYLGIGIALLLKTRRELGGVMTFKEGFTAYFISAVIGMLISTVFNFLLFNVIDPGAKETIKEITIEKTTSMMEDFNVPAAEIDKAIENIENTDNYSVGALIKGYVWGLLFSAIFGAILAAIFKKSPSNH